MKKYLVFLIAVLLFLFCCANAEEITFQNIPWMSDDETVLKELKDAGLIRKEIGSYVLSDDGNIILISDSSQFYEPIKPIKYRSNCYSLSLKDYVKGKIAGSPLQNLTAVFAYNGEFKLVSVKVELQNVNYKALKNKLTTVYGEGEESINEEDGIEATIWKGDNNSGILLYSEKEMMDYQLIYGRLDAAEILQNCLTPADPDDVSGL